jgi:hypothetical protein
MSADEQITCRIAPSDRFARGGVPVRLLIVVFLFVPATLNWIAVLVLLPLVVAARQAVRGASVASADADRMRDFLHLTGALYAHAGFLTDRFTLDRPEEVVSFDFGDRPSAGARAALARVLTSIPNVVVFAGLAAASFAVWLLAAVMVAATTSYPKRLRHFQRRVLCYETWLVAYQGSLAADHPSFRALA